MATATRIHTQAIERAEARAWSDLYAAAPPEFGAAAGIATRTICGALVLQWAAAGRRYFSRTIGLGVAEAASPEAIDQILRVWEEAGITMFLLQSLPDCEPAEYEDWLRDRGLEPFDAQERVLRGGEPLAVPDVPVERVDESTAGEWAGFVERASVLEAAPMLRALVGRPGWHHYVARRDGEVVAARSMHIDLDGLAWLGIDAPVPGLRTADYGPDAELCEFIVADGLARGARAFLADIEVPSAARDTPAYEYFPRLGFEIPYTRTHWTRP